MLQGFILPTSNTHLSEMSETLAYTIVAKICCLAIDHDPI